MGFIIVTVVFVWLSVKKTTTSKVNNEASAVFTKTVHAKLLELYGTDQVVSGFKVRVLPAELKDSVDAFYNRQ